VLTWFHTLRNTFLDAFFMKITHAGSLFLVLPAALVVAVILLAADRYREAKILALSVALTMVFAHGAKLAFKRPRPDIHPAVGSMPLDWSFPSAHTAQVTALCLCLAFFALRMLPAPWSWLVCGAALLLAGLVGLSRIYLQVHYPSDVLAGFLLACLIVFFSFFVVKS